MNTINIRKIIVSLVVIVTLGLLTKKIGSSFDSEKDKQKPKVTIIKPSLVQKLIIVNKAITPKFETEGKLTSSEVVSVSLEGKGTLKSSIALKEGNTFRKRQRIAFVEDNQANANFKASLYKYHQTLTNALIDIKLEYPSDYSAWNSFSLNIQNGKLAELPIVSNSKLNNYLSAKGIYNAYYDLKSVKTSLSKRIFLAPFNGYISNVTVQNGSFINGTTRICDISPQGKLELTFSLNGTFASGIAKGSLINIATSSGKALKGKITRIGNQINSITQQRDFTAQVISKSNTVIAGDFVKITIPLSKKPIPSIVIPSYCIDNNDLFIIKADSTLAKKTISVIGLQNDSLVVTGLEDKDILLLESYSNFNSGQKVRFN